MTLLAGPEATRRGTAAVLAAFGRAHGHVFNLGHGISIHAPESVAALVDAVHELSPAYH